jgi:hypothetical protein
VRLVCIPPAQTQDFWPHVAALIRAAMQKGRLTDFAEVERRVHAGRALLWLAVCHEDGRERPDGGEEHGGEGIAIKAAAVTELDAANGERFCTIVACGGSERRQWLPLIAQLEHYARTEDCKAMRIFGRRGWRKLLPDYRIARLLLEKRL